MLLESVPKSVTESVRVRASTLLPSVPESRLASMPLATVPESALASMLLESVPESVPA